MNALKPGKWYGVDFSEKRLIPALERWLPTLDELQNTFIERIKPVGMYVGFQWICQGKKSILFSLHTMFDLTILERTTITSSTGF